MKLKIFALTASVLIIAALFFTTLTIVFGGKNNTKSHTTPKSIEYYAQHQSKLEKYNIILKNASEAEKQNKLVTALALYWDAMEELKSYEAEEAYMSFEHLSQAIKAGNPGLDVYSDANRAKGWDNLLQDYEQYWQNNSTIYFVFSQLNKGADKTEPYTLKINTADSKKYITLKSIITEGYNKAFKKSVDLPQSFSYQYSIDITNNEGKILDSFSKLQSQKESILKLKDNNKTINTAVDAANVKYEIKKVYLVQSDKSFLTINNDNLIRLSAYDTSDTTDTDAYEFVSNSLKIQNLQDNLMVFVRGGVNIASFSIAKTETTQNLYMAVMGENPSTYNSKPAKGESQLERPVESVSWYDCILFCNKLSIITGRTPCYKVDGISNPDKWGYIPHQGDIISGNISCDFTVNGFRLPTEIEWKYAANGGSNNETYAYAGSNSIENVGWYFGNSDDKTHQVALKNPNSIGIYDLSGNVWEWCWDLYTSSYSNRVYRGGSANNLDFICELSNRHFNYSSRRYDNIGFRIVATAVN